jgi:hypothetical protein
MQLVAEVDWRTLFVPELPVLEVVIRGAIVYLLLFIVMRFLLRRRSAALALPTFWWSC